MVDSKEKITSFEQLIVWQKSQEVAVAIYKSVKKFPPEEKFGLSDQLKRSSSSISANIAEGFGRKSPRDKMHFYTIAYGSLLETKSHLYLANKLGYINNDNLNTLLADITINQKQLNAFAASIQR